MSVLGWVGLLMLPPVGHGSLPEAEQVRVQGSAETLRIIKCIAKRNMGRLSQCYILGRHRAWAGLRAWAWAGFRTWAGTGHGYRELTWRAVAP
jgi:hypothetical protein